MTKSKVDEISRDDVIRFLRSERFDVFAGARDDDLALVSLGALIRLARHAALAACTPAKEEGR